MEKYFNLATFGTLAVFALVLYAIMYFTKPAASPSPITVSTPATT